MTKNILGNLIFFLLSMERYLLLLQYMGVMSWFLTSSDDYTLEFELRILVLQRHLRQYFWFVEESNDINLLLIIEYKIS